MSLFLSSASSILSPPAPDWPLPGLQHQGRPEGKHVASTSPCIYVWLACRQVDYAKFSQRWKILFGFWNFRLHRTQLGMEGRSPCSPSGRECGGRGELDGPDVSGSAPSTEFTPLGPGLPGCQGLPKVWRKGKKRALWPAETVSASPFQ